MEKGRFGIHGGQYIPETLMNEIIHLEEQYEFYKNDPEFCAELDDLLKNYAGRPSLLYYAEKMTKDLGGAKIYLKREDLNHTGSHKINNVLGQVLMAKKMGKTRVIAETGAGQHGVACATAAALLGLECEIFMGKEDTDRQGAECLQNEAFGRKGASGNKRNPDLKGCSKRDDARVDKPRIGHPLCTGLCHGTASVSDDRAGFPVCHRTGGKGTDSGKGRKASGSCFGVCRRRQQCNGYVL